MHAIPVLAFLSIFMPTFCLAETPSNNPTPVSLVLTPKSPATPCITGPQVFGVRPNNPFLFTISATGTRPVTFSAENLPPGLTLDPATGQITGILTTKGETGVTLHAVNALGKAQRTLHIVCGNTIALTPPLGWNSWNCFGWKVTDAEVRSAADAMVSSGLVNHGWNYINIDDCWEGGRDANGLIQSNAKFPDMKALSDYIHSKGLKFGIYSSPGTITCGHATGSYQHEDQDAQRYAEWNVDYVKYDWCSYGRISQSIMCQESEALLPGDAAQIQALESEKASLEAKPKRSDDENKRYGQINGELNNYFNKLNPDDKKRLYLENWQKPYKVFRASLDKVKRDIVFSLCQYGMGNVWEWGDEVGGNCWRTKGDITDTWPSMTGIGFKQLGYEKYAGPGHWNDPDMLIVGRLGWGGDPHQSRLTPNEQYTHISLWCLLAAPLLIGCDMSQMDDFTYGLLSNDEVLDIDQDLLGKEATCLSPTGSQPIYARDLADGSKAVGLFNLGEQETKVIVKWRDLGIQGQQIVRDVWAQKDLGAFTDEFEATVPSHGVVLVRIHAK